MLKKSYYYTTTDTGSLWIEKYDALALDSWLANELLCLPLLWMSELAELGLSTQTAEIKNSWINLGMSDAEMLNPCRSGNTPAELADVRWKQI